MRTLLALGAVAVLLVGCANNDTQPDFADLTETWAFSGKMAVRNAREASSFNVDWVQSQASFEIELSGPLGQGRVEVAGRPGRVTLRQGDDVWHARSLTELGQRLADMNLPLDHLQYWVRGRASPRDIGTLTLDNQGRMTRLQQSGWTVNFPAYYGDGPDALPQRIDFERDDASGRLVIRNWLADAS